MPQIKRSISSLSTRRLPSRRDSVGWLLPAFKPKPEAVATHEAGHLFAALALGIPLQEGAATIIPEDGIYGCVRIDHKSQPALADRAAWENWAVVYLSGRAADEIRCDHCLDGCSFTLADIDLVDLDLILSHLVPSVLPRWESDWELKKMYRRILLGRASSLLIQNWTAVLALRDELLAKRVLTLDQSRRLLARHAQMVA